MSSTRLLSELKKLFNFLFIFDQNLFLCALPLGFTLLKTQIPTSEEVSAKLKMFKRVRGQLMVKYALSKLVVKE